VQQQDRGLTENLRAVFATFRQDPSKRFTVRLRQERAKQLRSLPSNPAAIDLATFNSEVWRLETRTHLRGKEIGKSIFEAPNSERVKEL
jgi:hypothetical protein